MPHNAALQRRAERSEARRLEALVGLFASFVVPPNANFGHDVPEQAGDG
jgi:hypothetical protein